VSQPIQRLRHAYGALDRDQRFAALAALGLLVTMFLPWYEKSVVVKGSASFAHETISAFGAVSFVEAAIFLVAAGVIVLLLARADRKEFHLPGGDGTVIFAAGLWASALIFYRVFDRPDVSGDAGTVGIQWGFFVAFVAAGTLAYAGQRIRAAHRPEPQPRARRTDAEREAERQRRTAAEREAERKRRTQTAPADEEPARPAPATAPATAAGAKNAYDDETEVVTLSKQPTEVDRSAARRNRAVTREDAQQLTFDDAGEPIQPGEIRRARDAE
jgi:hypothetical protein